MNNSAKYTIFTNRQSIKIPNNLITFAETKINRKTTVDSINKFLKNKEYAKIIEQSIFEFTIIKIVDENLATSILPSIYNDKTHSILLNLDKKSVLNNSKFIDRINKKEINISDIAFMNAEELFPTNWERYAKRKEYKQKQKDEVSVTNIYTCYRCGEKKCRVTQLQTRSADEPMTNFVTCMVCMNTFFK